MRIPYADTDFFLALLKSDDWLKESATRIYRRHRESIWTSGWAIAELLLVAEEFKMDPERLVADIFEIAAVRDANKETLKGAAHLMKRHGMSTFDALHAASCGDDVIVSSDSVYDALGLPRIKLGQ